MTTITLSRELVERAVYLANKAGSTKRADGTYLDMDCEYTFLAVALRAALNAPAPEAQLAHVLLTDEQIDAVTREQWGQLLGSMMLAHRVYARAIEAEVLLRHI
jgi:hypothetical protein